MNVMQSVAKHLACGSNSIDWITAAREMLRCALHDVSLLRNKFATYSNHKFPGNGIRVAVSVLRY